MYGETRPEDLRFKVECAWCGEVIRRYNVKDAQGMCLKCYARMIGEHGRPAEFNDAPQWPGNNRSER